MLTHDGGSPSDHCRKARHQQCLGHLRRRCHELLATAPRGAVRFPRRVQELLPAGRDLRDRHAAGQVSDHGRAVARGRLANALAEAVFPPTSNAANDRFAQHRWNHSADVVTFRSRPGVDATNGRAEQAIRLGVILRKVWGGTRT